ncbi:MAG: 16S rRNA (cytosine(967)-C(5))-methyltransferase RsmB [Planctomycetota bacterium]
MTANIRQIALQLLTQNTPQVFLKEEMSKKAATLSHRDRAFLQQLLYGCFRWHLTLAHLVTKFCHVSTTSEEYWILQLGFYQLLFLKQIPPYAAVNETVSLKSSVKGRRFLNGVLRTFQRSLALPELSLKPENSLLRRATEPPIGFKKPLFAHEDSLQQLSWRSSHPKWILSNYQQVMSTTEMLDVLGWNNENPPNTIRVNSTKISLDDLKTRFSEAGIQFQATLHPLGLNLELEANIFSHPLFLDGLFTVQDTWSMSVVDALHVVPEEHILDLCAAPGGKTTYIAEQLKNTGDVLAIDLDTERLQKIRENQKRLGLSNIHIQSGKAESMIFEKKFDKILLDVPCSNSGALARRIEARYRQQPSHLKELVSLQKKMLAQAIRWLKPEGRLVYSTCSLFVEENQTQIQNFLKDHPAFQLEQEQLSLPGNPHFSGGYVAVLRQKYSK